MAASLRRSARFVTRARAPPAEARLSAFEARRCTLAKRHACRGAKRGAGGPATQRAGAAGGRSRCAGCGRPDGARRPPPPGPARRTRDRSSRRASARGRAWPACRPPGRRRGGARRCPRGSTGPGARSDGARDWPGRGRRPGCTQPSRPAIERQRVGDPGQPLVGERLVVAGHRRAERRRARPGAHASPPAATRAAARCRTSARLTGVGEPGGSVAVSVAHSRRRRGGSAHAGAETGLAATLGGAVHLEFFAIEERLDEPDVRRAALQPRGSQRGDERLGQVRVHGHAGDQAAAEAVALARRRRGGSRSRSAGRCCAL